MAQNLRRERLDKLKKGKVINLEYGILESQNPLSQNFFLEFNLE
jgi:hypothetical protein